jgi:hypothetical protein
MSAFIVSNTHINALVRFATENNISVYGNLKQPLHVSGNEDATAQMLHDENVRSVNARYSGSTQAERVVYMIDAPLLSPVQAIKAAQCLQYQSCETDDWKETAANLLLEAIIGKAIRLLPGYSESPWVIRESSLPKGPVSLALLARSLDSRKPAQLDKEISFH